jgi:GntR family transcriptional regulator
LKKYQKKYEALADILRDDVKKGVFSNKLPGMANLTEHYSTNQRTLSTAIKVLADEDLLYTVPKKGTFIKVKEKALKKSNHIGLAMRDYNFLSSTTNLGSLLMNGINEALHEGRQYNLLTAQLYDDFTPPLFLENLEIQGAVVRGFHNLSPELKEQFKQVPIIVPFFDGRAEGMDTVNIDDDQTGTLIAEVLNKRKLHHYAILNPTPGHPHFARRELGLLRSKKVDGFYCEKINLEQEADLPKALDDIISRKNKIKGIVILGHDGVISSAYHHLAARGIDPTSELQLIGCVSSHNIAHGLNPSMTGIDLQVKMVGKLAIERLTHRIQQPNLSPCKILAESTEITPLG